MTGMAAGSCVLNFTSYPYQPTGECISDVKLKINVWDSWTTNLCCRNVLTTLSRALALHAFTTQGGVFVSDVEWNSCTGPFVRQESVSADNCGFDGLYYGSSNCSNVKLATIKQDKEYLQALNNCSLFGNSSSPLSFDDACGNCTSSMKELKRHLWDQYHQKNDNNKTENSICGVAAVISVAAGKINNSLLLDNDDYFRCLTKLDKFGKKLNYFMLVIELNSVCTLPANSVFFILVRPHAEPGYVKLKCKPNLSISFFSAIF